MQRERGAEEGSGMHVLWKWKVYWGGWAQRKDGGWGAARWKRKINKNKYL